MPVASSPCRGPGPLPPHRPVLRAKGKPMPENSRERGHHPNPGKHGRVTHRPKSYNYLHPFQPAAVSETHQILKKMPEGRTSCPLRRTTHTHWGSAPPAGPWGQRPLPSIHHPHLLLVEFPLPAQTPALSPPWVFVFFFFSGKPSLIRRSRVRWPRLGCGWRGSHGPTIGSNSWEEQR